MATIETVYKNNIHVSPEVELQRVSRFAYHVVLPNNLEKNITYKILLWGHGSERDITYDEMIANIKQGTADEIKCSRTYKLS
ncbi:hypothetical protein IT418_03670 [bacterium]|nr:hypothetical protein [bacterium]